MSQMHAQLLALIGDEMTLKLIELYGGTRLYIPNGPHVGTLTLAQQLSPAAEIALAGEYGGLQLKIPLAKAWRARIYCQRGMKHPEVARKLGCHVDAVLAYSRGGADTERAEAVSRQMAMPF